MKTTLITILLTLFCSSYIFSQNTKINIFIGGETTKLNDDYGDDVKVYFNEGFEAFSFLLGGEIEQSLVFNFDLVFRSSYGRKQVNDISDRDLVDGGPPFSVNFPHIYNSVLLKRKIGKRFKIGGGIGYNLFKPSFRFEPGYGKEFTGIIESSLNIKKFNINLSYTFGLENYFLGSENYFNLRTKPSQSFQLTIGYRIFNIAWKKQGKKVNCPNLKS